ncbi:hypothetical protein BC936DRAFT_149821 [Jimgerdemannia flammicorona]|uniref:Uncharacterized protein n=1 Tax=Jimgerdemannia flammicorona TaxID=994334 RepID=A0A433D028_9FUNG|nr:hypothetical protein BC936DRAFT_149821 [Jimgerdemannia flammicorona]
MQDSPTENGSNISTFLSAFERPAHWIINGSRRSQLSKAIDSQKSAQRQQNDMQSSTKRQRGLLTNETTLENLTQVYDIQAVSLEGKCYPRGINGSERAHGDVVELNDVPVHIENESDNIEVGNDVNVRKLLENWYGAFGERETLLGLLLDPDGKYYDEHSRSSKSPIDLEIDATKHISTGNPRL